MYCFSRICRICLTSSETELVKLNNFDTDNIKINDKLIFCIPEIFNPDNNLPEKICMKCCAFIQRMYEFKQKCIDNTIKLNKYASKLSNEPGIFDKNNLVIKLEKNSQIDTLPVNNIADDDVDEDSSIKTDDSTDSQIDTLPVNNIEDDDVDEDSSIKTDDSTDVSQQTDLNISQQTDLNISQQTDLNISQQTDLNISQQTDLNISQTTESTVTLNDSESSNISPSFRTTLEGVPMYSVSLNKWDLFETKYTCRCIKEFSSFTENTKHLCKNCEGELLGFRLSKIKVGVAEGRYSSNLAKIKHDDDADSYTSELNDDDSNDCEHGFDYNDVLLCKVHINGVRKQIDQLEDNISPNRNLSLNSCPICMKTFPERSYLNNHFLLHSGCKLHDCETCGEKYIHKNDLEKHKLCHADHQSDSEHNSSQSKTELNSSGEILACSTCDKTFPSKGKLAIHLMTHFGKKDYKCSACDREFFRKENLEVHFMAHHTMTSQEEEPVFKYQCPRCFQCFDHPTNVRKHLRSIHDVIQFNCIICTMIFHEKEQLDQHVFEIHTVIDDISNEVKYKCTNCDKCYTVVSNVRRHMRDHHDIQTCSCLICEELFQDKKSLDQHTIKMHALEVTHSEDDDEEEEDNEFDTSVKSVQSVKKYSNKYQCPKCFKVFHTVSNVRRHIRDYHNLKSFGCLICDKFFSEKQLLDQHLFDEHRLTDNIQEDRIYQCPNCDKCYINPVSVRRHLREKHGIKRYSCPICNEVFTEKQKLNSHVDEHAILATSSDSDDDGEEKYDNENEEYDVDYEETKDVKMLQTDEKKHKCLYCDKSYLYMQNVRRHMRTAHNFKNFMCSICNDSFVEKHLLEQHIFSVHTQADKSPDEKKGFSCPVCQKNFNHLSNLRMHALSHTDVSEEEESPPNNLNFCKICNKHYNKNISVSKHMMLSHAGDCSICSAKFENRVALHQHIATVHSNSNRVFECKDCFKSYPSIISLNNHRRIHTR